MFNNAADISIIKGGDKISIISAQIIGKIANGRGRQFLYHNTDIQNIKAISHFDAMYSCHHVDPGLSFNRRVTCVTRSIQRQVFIANDQLEIDDRMMATGITKQSYRALLDKHVFFWPTHNDCKKMYDSYIRKQPGNQRAIFKFRAYDF